MAGMVALVVIVHLGMAAVDLPALWGRKEKARERWVVLSLLLLGLTLALLTVLGFHPVSVYRLIEAVFEPVGTLLFKAKGG